jgi:hypothetical protein
VYRLTEKRFADYFRNQPETGMGYWVATAVLKDGRSFPQVVIDSGYVTKVKNHSGIPFLEKEIDHFVVTHDKWDFGST